MRYSTIGNNRPYRPSRPTDANPFHEAASQRLIERKQAGGQHQPPLGDSTRDVSDAELLHLFELERLALADAGDVVPF